MKETASIQVEATFPDGTTFQVIVGEDDLDVIVDGGVQSICVRKDSIGTLIDALLRLHVLHKAWDTLRLVGDEKPAKKPAKAKK